MPPSSDEALARAERTKRASQRPKPKREPGGQHGRRAMRCVDDPGLDPAVRKSYR